MQATNKALIHIDCAHHEFINFNDAVSSYCSKVIQDRIDSYTQVSTEFGEYAAGLLFPEFAGETKTSIKEKLTRECVSYWVANLCLEVPIGLITELSFLFYDADSKQHFVEKIIQAFNSEKNDLVSFLDKNPIVFAKVFGNKVVLDIPFSVTKSTGNGTKDPSVSALAKNPFERLTTQNIAPMRMTENAHMLTHCNNLQQVCISVGDKLQWVDHPVIEGIVNTVKSNKVEVGYDIENNCMQFFVKLNSAFNAAPGVEGSFDPNNKVQKIKVFAPISLESIAENNFSVETFTSKVIALLNHAFISAGTQCSGQDYLQLYVVANKPEFKTWTSTSH